MRYAPGHQSLGSKMSVRAQIETTEWNATALGIAALAFLFAVLVVSLFT